MEFDLESWSVFPLARVTMKESGFTRPLSCVVRMERFQRFAEMARVTMKESGFTRPLSCSYACFQRFAEIGVHGNDSSTVFSFAGGILQRDCVGDGSFCIRDHSPGERRYFFRSKPGFERQKNNHTIALRKPCLSLDVADERSNLGVRERFGDFSETVCHM